MFGSSRVSGVWAVVPGVVVDTVAFGVGNVRDSCGLQEYSASVDALHCACAAVVNQVHDAHVVFTFDLRGPNVVRLEFSECSVQKLPYALKPFAFHVREMSCVFEYGFLDAGDELCPVEVD